MTWQLSQDTVVNTFHFDVSTPDSPTFDTITAALVAAYGFLEGDFSAHVAVGPTGTVTYYNLSQPMPRPPLQTDSLQITRTQTNGVSSLPHEVALVMTYESPHVAGVNQQRHRGRAYFGPYDSSSNSEGRPEPLPMANAAEFGRTLITHSTTNPNWSWIVYSRVQGTGAVVINGWVDNEWDTQRRRGLTSENRTTFDANGVVPAQSMLRQRALFKGDVPVRR